MLRLGYYLLEEHFSQEVNFRRAANDLIKDATLDRALKRFTRHEYAQRPLLSASTPAAPLQSPTQIEADAAVRTANALERMAAVLDKWAAKEYAKIPLEGLSSTSEPDFDSQKEPTTLIQALQKLTLAVDSLTTAYLRVVGMDDMAAAVSQENSAQERDELE
jgi:hypothetical protein